MKKKYEDELDDFIDFDLDLDSSVPEKKKEGRFRRRETIAPSPKEPEPEVTSFAEEPTVSEDKLLFEDVTTVSEEKPLFEEVITIPGEVTTVPEEAPSFEEVSVSSAERTPQIIPQVSRRVVVEELDVPEETPVDEFEDVSMRRRSVGVEDLNSLEEPEKELDEDAMAAHISRNLNQASEHYLGDYPQRRRTISPEPVREEAEPEDEDEPEELPVKKEKRGLFGGRRKKNDDYDDYDEDEDDYDDEEEDDDDEEEEELTTGQKIRLAILGLLGVLIVCVCGIAVGSLMKNQQKINYYKSHFLPQTTINGIDCSEMTVDEVYAAFAAKVENFELHVQGVNGDFVITNDDAQMKMSIDIDFQDVLDQQDHGAYRNAEANPENLTISAAVSVDEDYLRKRVLDEAIFQNMTPSHSATITWNESTQSFEVGESVHGTSVNLLEVQKRVIECFKILKSELNLEEEGYYGHIVDLSDDVRKTAQQMTECMQSSVTLNFGDAGSETMTRERMIKCLEPDDDLLFAFNTRPLVDWLADLAEVYDTAGKVHKFHTTGGQDIEIEGGTYGWQINQEETANKIAESIKNGSSFNGEPVYTQTAASHTGIDVGTTYIEVNLTQQKLWYYRSGSLVLQTSIVSGDVKKGTITPTGVFSVFSKENDKKFVDENGSEQVVVNWMPFYGNYGICDASWRSTFSAGIYITNGSAGSIYVPEDIAKQLFDAIQDNTPVVIYGGQTEYVVPTTTRQTVAPTKPRQTLAPTRPTDDTEPTRDTGTNPPETDPTETNPPETDPTEDTGATDPTQDTGETDPPETDPPHTDPPETDPPETDPPQTDPPQTDPPQTDPPQTDPPQTDPPQTDPPAEEPAAESLE